MIGSTKVRSIARGTIARGRGVAYRLRRAVRRSQPDPTPVVATRWRPAGRGGPPIRVAVIGAGRVAPAHLAVLEAFDDVEIVGLASRGVTDPRPLAARFGVAETFTDFAVMLEQTRPDAVWVLVGPLQTVEVAGEVLAAGVPCLIEKPAGLHAAETAALAQRAAEHGCPNLVALNRRFHSVLEHALDAIYARGPLVGVHLTLNEPIAALRRRGGHPPAVLDRWLAANSVHGIDLLRRCGGEVTSIDSLQRHGAAGQDGFVACMRTDRDVLMTFAGHWRAPAGWRLVLSGDGIEATLSPLERGTLRFADGRRERLAIDEVDRRFKPGFYAQAAALLDAIGGDAIGGDDGTPILPPASNLADHVATMRLVEAIGGQRDGWATGAG